MLVNESIEGESIAPAGREVAHVDVGIAGGLHLTPEQQGVLGRLHLTTVVWLVLAKRDVLDLNIEAVASRPLQ